MPILADVSDFENLGFETEGAQVGRATSWTIASNCNAFEVMSFDSDALGFESFEQGWGVVLLAFDDAAFTAADFGASSLVETFDRLWGTPENSNGPFALGLTESATFGSESIETFESGWSNDDYFTSFAGGSFSVASFDTAPESFENFEEEWRNDDYFTSFAGGSFSVASFDASENVEDFEEVLAGVDAFEVTVATVGVRYWIRIANVEFEHIAEIGDGTDDIAIALRDAVNNSNFQVLASVITTDTVLIDNLSNSAMTFAAGPSDSIVRTTPTLQTTMWMLPLHGV